MVPPLPNLQPCWSFLKAADISFHAALPTPWCLRVEDFHFDKLCFCFPILVLVLFCGLASCFSAFMYQLWPTVALLI
jgi:hypothetical protein